MKSESDKDPEKGVVKAAPLLFSCRLHLFIVFMLSSFVFMLQRMNIGFALVCMVKRPNDTFSMTPVVDQELESSTDFSADFLKDVTAVINDDDEICKEMAANRSAAASSSTATARHSLIDEGEFEWSKDEQGAILASFFYGYILTQIFGGWLAENFGAKKAFLGSIAAISLLTLINPLAARMGPHYLFAVRLLMGLTHGAALPSLNVFAARWCAPDERGFLMGLAYGGFGFAAMSTFPICAVLGQHFGWPAMFYFSGGIGILLFFLSYFLVYEWPEVHPRISQVELEFLQKTRSVPYQNQRRGSQKSTSKRRDPVPWCQILTSLPINVVHMTHLCFAWGFLMVGMYLPTFLKEVLYMDTSKNGLYSSLPFVGMMLVHFTVGSIFDFFRRKNWCSVTVLRKIFNTVGMIAPAISMIVTAYLSCTNIEFGIALVTLGQAMAEFAFMGGYMLSIFELAPKYAGIIIGITNTFGVLPGFLCPLLVSFATVNSTRDEWLLVFGVAAALNVFGALLYAIFGSCELQPWASGPKHNEVKASSNGNHENGSTINGSNANGHKHASLLNEQELVPLTLENKSNEL